MKGGKETGTNTMMMPESHVKQVPQTTSRIENPQDTPPVEHDLQTTWVTKHQSQSVPTEKKDSHTSSSWMDANLATVSTKQDMATASRGNQSIQTTSDTKQESQTATPYELDSQVAPLEMKGFQTTSDTKQELLTALPEKQDSQIDPPEKKDSQTDTPLKHDTQATPSDKQITQTDSSMEQDIQAIPSDRQGTQTDSSMEQDIQAIPSSSMDNMQQSLSATDAEGSTKKQEMEIFSDDLKQVIEYWLESWYDKKQSYHMNDCSIWERAHRGIFWLAKNPHVPDQVPFIKENENINMINGAFSACSRLMDYIVYFMELILHPEMLGTPFVASSTEDVVFSMISNPEQLETISTFATCVYKIYHEAVKEDVQDLQKIRNRPIKNLFYGLVSIFEYRLENAKSTNGSLVGDWNQAFLSTKNSLEKVSSEDIGLTKLLQQIDTFKTGINPETPLGFSPVDSELLEVWTISERDRELPTWTMKEGVPFYEYKRTKAYAHARLIARSALDLISNIVKVRPHIGKPLSILRESFETFHGGFDPFHIQLIRTQLKKVFNKDINTIIFDPLAYKCAVDTFSDMYDEHGPTIVDNMNFECDGFQFNLDSVEVYLKDFLPNQAEFIKKTAINEEITMYDFKINDGSFNIVSKKFGYTKISGLPLYRDHGQAHLAATGISYHLILSIFNNNVQVEYCKCEIEWLDIELNKSTRNSIINFFIKIKLGMIMKRKLQALLEQAFTNAFTNIFL